MFVSNLCGELQGLRVHVTTRGTTVTAMRFIAVIVTVGALLSGCSSGESAECKRLKNDYRQASRDLDEATDNIASNSIGELSSSMKALRKADEAIKAADC